jgi:hypothetical protein
MFCGRNFGAEYKKPGYRSSASIWVLSDSPGTNVTRRISTDFQILISCEQPNVTLWTEYTYMNTDPVGQTQQDSMPFADITQQPASYWAQAVVIYWWDMLSVNLTQANEANFNSTLQSVLFQGMTVQNLANF